MKKKKQDDEDLDFLPENNDRPLTAEELEKIEQKKKIKELREKSGNIQAVIVTKSGEVKTADKLTAEEQRYEYLKCGLDPIYFIETYLTVFDQTAGDGGKIVPFKLFEIQKDLIKAYQKNKYNIANKYRQAGISTTTCAYIAWYLMFTEDRYVAVVADKLETARDELVSDIIDFIDGCPAYLHPGISGKNTLHHKQYKNRSQIKAFAATKLRGPTPTLVFWDETAHTENGEKFWTSAGPAVRNTGGNVIMVSTPLGLDEIFYKTFDMAIRKENDFNAVELWWYNDPRYIRDEKTREIDLEWIKYEGKPNEVKIKDTHFSIEERKKLVASGYTATSSWFRKAKLGYNGDMRKLSQEILCNFNGSGENFIQVEFIKRIEDNELREPIRYESVDQGMWIFEDPIRNAEYVMSLDISAGYGEDFSSIQILKITDHKEKFTYYDSGKQIIKDIKRRKIYQVAEFYGKVTPQTLADIGYEYGTKYNNALAVVDVNGVGLGTVEKLFEYGYMNVYRSEIKHRPTRDRLKGYIKTKEKEITPGNWGKVDLVPGFMALTGIRGLTLNNLEQCIRLEFVVVRSRRLVKEFKTFLTEPGTTIAKAARSSHDDAIFALTNGLYVVCWDYVNAKEDVEKTKAVLDAMLAVNGGEYVPEKEENKTSMGKIIENLNFNPRPNPYGEHAWMMKNLKRR